MAHRLPSFSYAAKVAGSVLAVVLLSSPCLATDQSGGGANFPDGGGSSIPQGGGDNAFQGGGSNPSQGGVSNVPDAGGAGRPGQVLNIAHAELLLGFICGLLLGWGLARANPRPVGARPADQRDEETKAEPAPTVSD